MTTQIQYLYVNQDLINILLFLMDEGTPRLERQERQDVG